MAKGPVETLSGHYLTPLVAVAFLRLRDFDSDDGPPKKGPHTTAGPEICFKAFTNNEITDPNSGPRIAEVKVD